MLLFTVIVHDALFPFEVLAVIVAVPTLLAVTLPLASTSAMLFEPLDHVTDWFAFDGETAAISVIVSPNSIEALVLLSDIL